MLTRCPNPRCKHSFEIPEDRAGKNGPCPHCAQVITFRPMGLIEDVEREHLRRTSSMTKPVADGRYSALLEDIRSLWNVGSIFRSADGAGFAPLYLCGITGSPPHKAILKTSLGAEEFIPWQHYSGALEILPHLKEHDVQIIALETTPASLPLTEVLAEKIIRPPLCLLVGNEVSGLSAEALSMAEVVCHLPMRGTKQSLNVAVAFGIAAYAIGEKDGL